jgi:hypothetical protein
MDTVAYICYIPAMVRIQVRSLESIFIERSSYESRTKLVLPFKKIREYSGKKKKRLTCGSSQINKARSSAIYKIKHHCKVINDDIFSYNHT